MALEAIGIDLHGGGSLSLSLSLFFFFFLKFSEGHSRMFMLFMLAI
jgi:hypothetical protein